jgi:hypothetical protein
MTRPRPALFVMLAVFLSTTALAFAAPSLAQCKWCGSSFASLSQLLASPCSRRPSRKHEPYEGAARQFYLCKYCAFESRSFEQLVLSPCSKSPSKYHQAYEGPDRPPYTCALLRASSMTAEFLPRKNSALTYRRIRAAESFKQLVLSPCRKSPRGYHEAR